MFGVFIELVIVIQLFRVFVQIVIVIVIVIKLFRVLVQSWLHCLFCFFKYTTFIFQCNNSVMIAPRMRFVTLWEYSVLLLCSNLLGFNLILDATSHSGPSGLTSTRPQTEVDNDPGLVLESRYFNGLHTSLES